MPKRNPMSVAALRLLVERRAESRCEYCRAPQRICGYRFHIDHIIPRSRGGSDMPSNRALACASCNLAKTNRCVGAESSRGEEVALFHPRNQVWDDHFRWADDGTRLLNRTPEGSATIAALDMNSTIRLEARLLWFATGWLP